MTEAMPVEKTSLEGKPLRTLSNILRQRFERVIFIACERFGIERAHGINRLRLLLHLLRLLCLLVDLRPAIYKSNDLLVQLLRLLHKRVDLLRLLVDDGLIARWRLLCLLRWLLCLLRLLLCLLWRCSSKCDKRLFGLLCLLCLWFLLRLLLLLGLLVCHLFTS